MQKKVRSLFLCMILLFSLSLPAYGANQVGTMDIQAVLYEDGSLYVTQIWDGYFDEGTEVYIPMNTPDYMTVSQLIVSDQNGSFETVPEWNVDWSFEEKASKCGINKTGGGYEICFGISRYGQNRYAIEYKLDHVVGAYSDRDGVNFRFVNDGMNTTPTDVSVEIRLADGTPLTDEAANIWGFGYNGQVEFSDGVILAYTQSPLMPENHVTILLSLEKGILSPTRQETGSFDSVREAALEGSDYDSPGTEPEETTVFEMLLGFAVLIGAPVALIVFFTSRSKKRRKKKLSKLSEQFGYFRAIPNEGNLSATYALGRMFDACEEGAILATGMLRLIQLGCLSPLETQAIGFMGKTKESVNLRLMGGHHEQMNEFDEYLYTVLEGAAGPDKTLQAKELERFANQNDKLLRTYIDKQSSSGNAYLRGKRCLKRWSTPARIADLTPTGEQELGQLLGLRRYLTDFSLINQRGVGEIPIWRELLSYAMLFGIADQVAQQMKALYPQISTQLDDYSQSLTTAYSYHDFLYRSMKAAEQQREQEERSGGGGGFASLGGGGGSVGGGSGGGTR